MGFKANLVSFENFLVLRRKVKSPFAFVTEKTQVEANNVYGNGERDLDELKESLGMENSYQGSVNSLKFDW